MLGRPLMRRGRPGLLGTVARTAVVAGTATAVSGAVSQRQQAHAATQRDAQAYRDEQAASAYAQPAYAPPPQVYAPAPNPAAGDTTDDLIQRLRELGQLKADGILTEEEFSQQKARLLNS